MKMSEKKRRKPSFRNEGAVEESAALRIPPHSMEAEIGVLGSILLDYGRVLDLCVENGVVPSSFWHPGHALIYEACARLSQIGQPVDVLTVTEHLRVNGRLEEAGGAIALERIVNATPTAAHAPSYIDILAQKHLLRDIISASTEAQNKCYEEASAADLILSESEQALFGIAERRDGGIVQFGKAVGDTVNRIDKVFEHGAESLGGISTGFKSLDRIMYGLRESEMVVLAARPSMGKTSLAMNICENIARGIGNRNGGQPVLIFSAEMSAEAITLRMLCSRAKVSQHDLSRGMVPRTEFAKLQQVAEELKNVPLHIVEKGGIDIMEVRGIARRMKRKHGIKFVMIDYLQLLHSREYAQQGWQLEVANISANIKAMAKELKVPVMVLSQLNRQTEQRGDGKPRLSDLRDSGAIEQDADVVMMLRRPCRYDGADGSDDKTLAVVDIAKHRNGMTGEAEMTFVDTFTTFYDREKKEW